MLSNLLKRLIFVALLIVDSELDVRVKRSDIDLQTCINKFNVHKDKIIRTQDSQNMGAKYLNEIDLGSREECLHLCCETENCDVFVFEEKNAGSCYLFHCGPPEDFKCKFTHHVNYSSAILSINRHLPDLESQIKLTKHEQDLTKLRRPDLEPETPRHNVQEIRPTPSTTTTILPRIREVIPVTSNRKIPEEDPKCTRFQFECRSTRECIAIYNACDGIPQCADGSDEGPELGCPEASVTTATSFPILPNSVPVQPLIRYDNVPPQIITNQQGMYIQQQQPIHETPQMLSPVLRTEADFLRPGNVNINPRIPFDGPALQPYMPPQLPPQGQTNWMPHQSNQMPPQITQYADKSRIFNHKETGFQVPDGQEIRYNKYKGAMQYLHRALGYSGGGGQAVPSYPKIGNYYPETNYRQSIPQENFPPAPKVGYKYPAAQETPTNINDNVVNPKHVQEQLAHDLKHSKTNMNHGVVHSNKVIIKQHPHNNEEQYPDVIAYQYSGASDLEDGMAHTQKGAVLSVSLGLIITFIMAILIGCRLKVVRRRMRKGGKAYAHEADFLVNGMYL